jgi:CDP-diacylglycerol--glycerol-3-phosphate 3-phosphatidyltransferase
LAPPIALLLSMEDAWAVWSGAGLFAVAALTDGADGWIARRYGQSTLEGAFLDPLADKLVVLAVLGALLWWRVAPWLDGGDSVAARCGNDPAPVVFPAAWGARAHTPLGACEDLRADARLGVPGCAVGALAERCCPHAQWAQELLFGWVSWSLLLGMTLLALWTLGLYGWRYRALWLRRLPVE